MAKYKNQHFTAKRYLKRFTNESDLFTFFNGKEYKDNISYKEQCQKDWFYSANNAGEVESILVQGENILFDCFDELEKYVKSEKLTSQLLLGMVDLHIRSSKYLNKTDDERFNVLNDGGLVAFLSELIAGVNQSVEFPELFYNLSAVWKGCVLTVPKESKELLIASCSPSVIVNDNLANEPCLLFLPISPYKAVVLADLRRYVLNKRVHELTYQEIIKLNALTCVNANSGSIYSVKPLVDEQKKRYAVGLLNGSFSGDGEFSLDKKGKVIIKPFQITMDQKTLLDFDFIDKGNDKFRVMPYTEAISLLLNKKVIIDGEKKDNQINAKLSVEELYFVQLAWSINNGKI